MAASSLTDEMRVKLLKLIRKGNTHDDAAKACRISPATLKLWAVSDRDFGEALGAAESEGKAAAIEKLYDAGDKDWKAALALLERKYPGEWGLKQIVQIETEKVFDALVGRLQKVPPAAVFGLVVRALHEISAEGNKQVPKQLTDGSGSIGSGNAPGGSD